MIDRGRFHHIAAGFEERRVVVLGDVMLDRYVAGPADRVSPEAPVPVVFVDREWEAPGGAANVAANVRALGARCDLVGVVGEDAPGEALEDALGRIGARCRLARDGSRTTTVKTRVLARGQQVVRIDREESARVPLATRDELAGLLGAALPGAHALVIADYDKGVLSEPLIRAALGAAATHSVPVLADPKRRHFHAYEGALVLKPNRGELEAALGEPVRPDDPAWMEAARTRAGCDHLLLTLGGEGMVLVSPEQAPRHVRIRARSVYDVSGAGDIVAAVVAVSLAAGATLFEAVTLAAVAAAAGVAKIGVATVAPEEIATCLPASPGESATLAAQD